MKALRSFKSKKTVAKQNVDQQTGINTGYNEYGTLFNNKLNTNQVFTVADFKRNDNVNKDQDQSLNNNNYSYSQNK